MNNVNWLRGLTRTWAIGIVTWLLAIGYVAFFSHPATFPNISVAIGSGDQAQAFRVQPNSQREAALKELVARDLLEYVYFEEFPEAVLYNRIGLPPTTKAEHFEKAKQFVIDYREITLQSVREQSLQYFLQVGLGLAALASVVAAAAYMCLTWTMRGFQPRE